MESSCLSLAPAAAELAIGSFVLTKLHAEHLQDLLISSHAKLISSHSELLAFICQQQADSM